MVNVNNDFKGGIDVFSLPYPKETLGRHNSPLSQPNGGAAPPTAPTLPEITRMVTRSKVDAAATEPAAIEQPAIDKEATLIKFLSAVLPESGWYAAVSKHGKRWSHEIVASVEELARKVREYDKDGKDAYFTTASLKVNSSREGGMSRP